MINKRQLLDVFRTDNINNRYQPIIDKLVNEKEFNEDEYHKLFLDDILKLEGMVKLGLINHFDEYHIKQELNDIDELINQNL